MSKIPDNASADRLIRLFNRNLGTDFSQIKPNKNGAQSVDEADQTKKHTVEADNRANRSSTVKATTGQGNATAKHQALAAKSGLTPANVYSKSQMNINQRAQRRRQLAEARKQHNIESIMSLAMDYCSETASNEDIDPDWFNQFIQQAEEISSHLMQELWGKILAGEIARPGTFSFKSLTILKRMTNKEAVAFQHACQLAMTNRKDNSSQVIYGYYQKPGLLNFLQRSSKQHVNLSKLNMPYPELLMLMDIELIYHSEIESGELHKGESVEYSYLGSPVKFSAKRNATVLNYFKFTQTGSELAKLIRLNPAKSYLDELETVFTMAFDIERVI
ncbi:MAG: putative repeat protein (TIGR03899 family) [Alteromonadaceae bacterium]|jgi:uncharacterized repeat protein (TIGR03899 family)